MDGRLDLMTLWIFGESRSVCAVLRLGGCIFKRDRALHLNLIGFG